MQDEGVCIIVQFPAEACVAPDGTVPEALLACAATPKDLGCESPHAVCLQRPGKDCPPALLTVAQLT